MFSLFLSFVISKNFCIYVEDKKSVCPPEAEELKIETNGQIVKLPSIPQEEEQNYQITLATTADMYSTIEFENETKINQLTIIGDKSKIKIGKIKNEIETLQATGIIIESDEKLELNVSHIKSENSEITENIVLNVNNFISDYSTFVSSNSEVFMKSKTVMLTLDDNVVGILLGDGKHTFYTTENKNKEISIDTKDLTVLIPANSDFIEMFHLGIKEGATSINNLPKFLFNTNQKNEKNIIFDYYENEPTLSQEDSVTINGECKLYSSLKDQQFPKFVEKKQGIEITKQNGKYCIISSQNDKGKCKEDELIFDTSSLFYEYSSFKFHENEESKSVLINFASSGSNEPALIKSVSFNQNSVKITTPSAGANHLKLKGDTQMISLEIENIFIEITDKLTLNSLNVTSCKASGSIVVLNEVNLVKSDDFIRYLTDCSQCTVFNVVLDNSYSTLQVSKETLKLRQKESDEIIEFKNFKTLTLETTENELIFEPIDISLSSFDYDLVYKFPDADSRLIIDYRWEKVNFENSENHKKISFTATKKLTVSSDYDDLPTKYGFIEFKTSEENQLTKEIKQKGFICFYQSEKSPENCRKLQGKPIAYKPKNQQSGDQELIDLSNYDDILNIVALDSSENDHPIISTNQKLNSLRISNNSFVLIHNKVNSLSATSISLESSNLMVEEKEINAKTLSLTLQSTISSNSLISMETLQLDVTSFVTNQNIVSNLILQEKVKIEIYSFNYITFSSDSFKLDNIGSAKSSSFVTLVIDQPIKVTVTLDAAVTVFPVIKTTNKCQIQFESTCFGEYMESTTSKLIIDNEYESITLLGNSKAAPSFIELSGNKDGVIMDFKAVEEPKNFYQTKTFAIALFSLLIILVIAGSVLLCMKKKRTGKMPGTPQFESEEGDLSLGLTGNGEESNQLVDIL